MPQGVQELPYGILSIKAEQAKGEYSLACSDGSIRYLSLKEFSGVYDAHFTCSFENKRHPVCLMHDTTSKLVAGCYSDGSLTVFDRETGAELLDKEKLHQFEVWFTLLKGEGERAYTCSDDCSFKAVDLRSGEVIYTNKKHGAGVTWISHTFPNKESQLLTCSYDGSVKLWDERVMKQPLAEVIFPDKALWDIKFNHSQDQLQMGIAAIYDGYYFIKTPFTSMETLFNQVNEGSARFKQYTRHDSICYAFEYVPESDLLVTTSFYDNTVQVIQQL